MGKGSAPKPSQEEKNLQAAQTQALNEQNAMVKEQYETTKLLAPFLYTQAGVKPVYDDEGKLVRFDKSDDPKAKLQDEVEMSLLQRSKDALEGKLAVDPNVTSGLEEEEKSLREVMGSRLGPGWETSTPGIQALTDFSKRKQEVLASSRRGDLTVSEALSAARTGTNMQKQLGYISADQGPAQSLAALMGQSAAGYGQSRGMFQAERMQAGQNAAQNKSAMFAAGGTIVGTAAGVAIAM